MVRLGAKQLRVKKPSPGETAKIKRHPIFIILDNVLDTYNTGAIFRLADAVAAEKIFLCGDTEIPPDHKIFKASVGTYRWVPWEYQETGVQAIEKLRQKLPKIKIVAIEQGKENIPYFQFKPSLPLALVVGNETKGISKEVLKETDYALEIPMWGVNKSLNVMVSLTIVLFKIVEVTFGKEVKSRTKAGEAAKPKG